MIKEDINYALVEEKRPPLYTAMKYWGKKPHNIWRTYIETYTPKNGVYFDPFAGSAFNAFEAVKTGRRAIIFDLNPMTSFIIEVFSSKFDRNIFKNEVLNIISSFENDETYLKYFSTDSRLSEERALVQNFKWENGKIYELGVLYTENEILKAKAKKKTKKNFRYLAMPSASDHKVSKEQEKIDIPYWYPNDPFPKSPSFTASFINGVGGNNFAHLWTKRNLYVLSKIFYKILSINDSSLKKQLLFGFIQTLHLTTKMCIPRRANANRPFSTSWGRSAYICSNRKMEMNPLLVFRGSCLGKQSVESCLSNVESYISKIPKISMVSSSRKNRNKLTGFDIKYGIVDINTLNDYLHNKSIDFIMTDPPYGGLVQYLDLSTIWLNWLKKVYINYTPNYDAEITIKKGIIDIDLYRQRFTAGLKNLYKVLKDEGKIVFTFHNKEFSIWNTFLKSITLAGFKIEKVIHQQNRRTGESNVANPYGTSGTDFYIRCIKNPKVKLSTDQGEFEHYVLTEAIEIIALRNEPTPYQFLFNGLLTAISEAGFDLENFDKNVKQVLDKHVNKIFKLTSNNFNKAGELWWFINPSEHIKFPDRHLIDRVEESIIALLRRKTSVSFDDVLADLFIKYPNGLTPDIKSIYKILMKYATKSGGRWLFNVSEVEKQISKHTDILYKLSKIGKNLGYKIFIGKREQQEKRNTFPLSNYLDYFDLSFIKLNPEKINRIEMIDMLWLNSKNEIELVIEVENTTNFISSIQRASNLSTDIIKLMIIPDKREKEITRLTDPYFIESFSKYNWKYLIYSDVDKIFHSKGNWDNINIFSKRINVNLKNSIDLKLGQNGKKR